MSRLADLLAGKKDVNVKPAATIDDTFVPPPAQTGWDSPPPPDAHVPWTASDVAELEASYRGCLTETQTAAFAADRMEAILAELKHLHGIT